MTTLAQISSKKNQEEIVSKLRFHLLGIGQFRDDSVRPYPACHPELAAKDLCPGGKAELREILRFTRRLGSAESSA